MKQQLQGRLAGLRLTSSGDLVAILSQSEELDHELVLVEQLDQLNEQSAQHVFDRLSEQSITVAPTVLLLPSHLFYCVTVTDPDLRRLDRDALLFAIEPDLPTDIESVVIDIVRTAHSTLVIALEWAPIRSFVNELERLGLLVRSISSDAMIEAERLIDSEPSIGKSDGTLVIELDGNIEWVSTLAGKPVRWVTHASNPAETPSQEISKQSSLSLLTAWPADGVVWSEHLSETASTQLAASGLDVRPIKETESSRAFAERLEAIAAGRVSAAFEFRRGELDATDRLKQLRRPLVALATACLLFLLVVNAGIAIRTAQFRALTQKHDEAIRDAYQSAFPEQRVPAGVVSRLESERARLRQQQAADVAISSESSALHALVKLVDSIPSDIRLFVTRLGAQPNQMQLEGIVRRTDEWESVVQGMRAAGIALETPQERVDESGMTVFTILGQPRANDDQSQ